MAGFWDIVPNDGSLVPVTKEQLFQDLVNNSDQTQIIGWSVRDSFFNLLTLAVRRLQEWTPSLTRDQLFLYYASDPDVDLTVAASGVALELDVAKNPRYAKASYSLDPTTGWITQCNQQVFSRWPFWAQMLAHPVQPDFNKTTE